MTEQVDTTFEHRTDGINLSAVAATKVKSLLEQEGRDDLQLRISVQPGGCSGLRYQLFFDERTLDGDVVSDFGGVAEPAAHVDERNSVGVAPREVESSADHVGHRSVHEYPGEVGIEPPHERREWCQRLGELDHAVPSAAE